MNVKEAAAYIGLGRNRMYNLIHQKNLPAIKIGKQFRIPIKSLNDWLETSASKNLEIK